MDAPAETHLESTSDASNVRNNLPQLSRSQTTLDGPDPNLHKRKSLRLRPTEVSERQHATEPPSPLKEEDNRPELRRARSSKMSLFNLFSKPKVEKLRGYAESGLDTTPSPPRAMSNNDATAPKIDLLVRVQNVDASPGRTRSSSSKSYAARSATYTSREAVPALPNGGRTRAFDPPPLFQVWPQTTKHGVLEVSTMSPEMVLSRPARGRISNGFFAPHAEPPSLNAAGHRGSIEPRMVVRPASNHAANGALANQSVPKKLVVLVTSGFLLQYAETGANDRLPEKVLQLGEDSAAYASDVIPGRHHVLQIAQQVDQLGSMSASRHYLLSRFTMRNHAARRTTNNFLLVMPNAQEMAEWMSVIRKEIEIQGGKRLRSDSDVSRASKAVSGDTVKLDLKKTPSQSHRYQVKRSPDGPAAITTPSSARLEPLPSPSLPPAKDSQNHHAETTSTKSSETGLPAFSEVQLPPTRPRASSNATSDSSSTAASVEQQSLEGLRDSARQSHTSTVATSVTAASRTNSMSSTPPPEKTKDVSEVPAKSPFRGLPSYSLANRRSATPLSLKATPLLAAARVDGTTTTTTQQITNLVESALDSPVIGYPSLSLKKERLSCAQSVPNLKNRSLEDARRDSKVQILSSAAVRERPESFLADLPTPTTWTTKVSAAANSSALRDTAARTMHKVGGESAPVYSLQSRPLRSGSNSFSLPLRVNLIATVAAKTSRSVEQPEYKLLSPIPAVHCLTAKVEMTALPKIEGKGLPERVDTTSPVDRTTRSSRTTSARLSLLPTTVITPPTVMPPQAKAIRRSPSANALVSYAHVQTNGAKLPRPNSLQVNTTYAPFLSSKCTASPVSAPARSAPTMPIRSLKPSRSVATMQTSPSSIPEEPFNFDTLKLHDEASDRATPLLYPPPEGALPPIPTTSRPPSRTRQITRKGSGTPLLEVDFGIPIAALGPPAPPPQAPLPEIPSGSRPASRQTNSRLSMARSGTPIGVAIGDTLDERIIRSPSPAMTGPRIQVGGAN